jgi:hypothetical protein
MGLFKKRVNKNQVSFIHDVIEGRITDMVKIAQFLSANGRLDIDDQTYKAFEQAIEKIQRDKRGIEPEATKFMQTWKQVDNNYERDFVVVGVGYDNRQEIIANVKKRQPLTIKETKYKGEPAIEVLFENHCIGYIAEEDVEILLEKIDFIIQVVVERTYTNSKVDKGLYAKVIISSK